MSREAVQVKRSNRKKMEYELLESIRVRDLVDKRFSQLFEEVPLVPKLEKAGEGDTNVKESSIKNLKDYLKLRDEEVYKLKDILSLKNRDTERLNDELLSANIESNLLQERLEKLQQEYDRLIERWLLKAQKEADTMNSHFK